MPPRITLNRKDGELQIWVNPEGRDLLVRELQRLSERSDHFHFMPEDMDGEVPVRNKAYEPDAEVIEWGKVLFRPDEWDARYYPHVLDDPELKGTRKLRLWTVMASIDFARGICSLFAPKSRPLGTESEATSGC